MEAHQNYCWLIGVGGRFAPFLIMSLMWLSLRVMAEPVPLTIEAGIETTRAMTDRNGRAVFVSPDERRYAVLLVRGDASKNGVWVELRVGELASLDGADPRVVARLFTSGLGRKYEQPLGAYKLTWPMTNPPVWIDDHRVALYWTDGSGTHQLFGIDVETGSIEPLTEQPTDVSAVAFGPKGQFLMTSVVPCEPSHTQARRAEGQVVEAKDAFELLFGCGARDRNNYTWFVSAEGAQARRISFEYGDPVSYFPPRLATPVFSGDGNFALVSNTVTTIDVPEDWDRYTQPHFRNILAERKSSRTGGYARQIQQLFVVDIQAAQARPLWNVPTNAWRRVHAAWSPDDASVLIGPSFVPAAQADETALAGDAVVEVDIRTGAWRVLPLPSDVGSDIREVRWKGKNRAEIVTPGMHLAFLRDRNGWKLVSTRVPSDDGRRGGRRVEVELRQDLNTPPVLYAMDTHTHRERKLLDLNPGLTSKYALGHVEWVDLEMSGGGRWEGRLYYPINYEPGRRYPLVIHTHTYAGKHEYSLYSKGGAQPALGPGGSVYIAQALAGQGFFVLHGHFIDRQPTASLLIHTQRQLAALEYVVELLVAESKVDRARVGIMGHSASGWLASYALTHSKFPYAAAITDDHKDGSYLQASLLAWNAGIGSEMIGAEPFGAGLCQWLMHSPALNAEHVRTPLLMSITSGGTEIGAWDMFSRLRYLRKPVELYLIPDVEIGTHGLQNPKQIRALQQRALDWWRFWLKDELDMDSAKSDQYANWLRLRTMRDQTPERSHEPVVARDGSPCAQP